MHAHAKQKDRSGWIHFLHRSDGSSRVWTRQARWADGTRKLRRKWLVLSMSGLLLFGGVAGAAWILYGEASTSSTETTGQAGNVQLQLQAGSLTDALTPGATSNPIQMSVTNTTQSTVLIPSITVQVGSTTGGANCLPSNFTVSDPQGSNTWIDSTTGNAVSLPYNLPAGDTLKDYGNFGNTWQPVTVSLNTDAANGCQNVSVNLLETIP